MAETNITIGLGEILPDIEVSSSTGVILLYSSKAIQLPHILEQQPLNVANKPKNQLRLLISIVE